LSEEFWLSYAEPVEDFIEAASLLLSAVTALGTINPHAETDENDLEKIDWGMGVLHSLVRTVGPAVIPKPEGSLRQEWVSTSLLGAFAMMGLLDLTESRRILGCENCGTVFVSRSRRAKYCSQKCRLTTQKRRHRARKLQSGPYSKDR
jgi:hypothetical protein